VQGRSARRGRGKEREEGRKKEGERKKSGCGPAGGTAPPKPQVTWHVPHYLGIYIKKKKLFLQFIYISLLD
jgi:hypothetical protein